MEVAESIVYQEIFNNLNMYYSDNNTFEISSKGLYYNRKRYSNNTKQYGKTKKSSEKSEKQLEKPKKPNGTSENEKKSFKNCLSFLSYFYKKLEKNEHFSMNTFVTEGSEGIIEASKGYIRRFLYKNNDKDFLFMFFNGIQENSDIYLLKSTEKLEEKIKQEIRNEKERKKNDKDVNNEENVECIEEISQLAKCMGLTKENDQKPEDVDISTYFTCEHLGEYKKIQKVNLETNKSNFNIYHLVIVNENRKVCISDPFSLMSDKQFIRRYKTSFIYKLYKKYKNNKKYYNLLKYYVNIIFDIKSNGLNNNLLFGIGFYSKSDELPITQYYQKMKEIYYLILSVLFSSPIRMDISALYQLIHYINISPSFSKGKKLDLLKTQLSDIYSNIKNQLKHSYTLNGNDNNGNNDIQRMLSYNNKDISLTQPHYNHQIMNPLLGSHSNGINIGSLYHSNGLCNYDNLKCNAIPFPNTTVVQGNDPFNLGSNTLPHLMNLGSNALPIQNTTVAPGNDQVDLKSTSEIDRLFIDRLIF